MVTGSVKRRLSKLTRRPGVADMVGNEKIARLVQRVDGTVADGKVQGDFFTLSRRDPERHAGDLDFSAVKFEEKGSSRKAKTSRLPLAPRV